MIVKKLGMVSGGGFPGAGYNERKVVEGVARLMAMENVDAAMRHKVECCMRPDSTAPERLRNISRSGRGHTATPRPSAFSSTSPPQ